MALRHTPITPCLGASVEGVDLARITPAEFRELHALWMKHHVLVLHGQRLTDAGFERFASLLGDLDPPEDPEPGSRTVPGHPKLHVVTNRKASGGEPLGAVGDTEASWHSDLSYLERPPLAGVLWALEVPATGGDTWFASMPAALRSMPEDLVSRIRRLAIKHDATYDSRGNVRKGMVPDDDPTRSAGTLHPAIIAQPDTGEETLFLGRRRNACIAGKPLVESERLLNIIWSYATAEAVKLRHRWQVGDVALFNNLTTMHRRDAFPPDQFRTMHRAQVRGTWVPCAPVRQEEPA